MIREKIREMLVFIRSCVYKCAHYLPADKGRLVSTNNSNVSAVIIYRGGNLGKCPRSQMGS
jgi:hypothetical protein